MIFQGSERRETSIRHGLRKKGLSDLPNSMVVAEASPRGHDLLPGQVLQLSIQGNWVLGSNLIIDINQGLKISLILN